MSIESRVQQTRFPSLASQAYVSLIVAAETLRHEVGLRCAEHGVTGDQYNVLRILRGVHPGAYSREEIRRRLIRPTTDVTRMIDRLVRIELAGREPGENDRRRSMTRITLQGLHLLERLDPAVEQVMVEKMAALKSSEQRELARFCGRLVA